MSTSRSTSSETRPPPPESSSQHELVMRLLSLEGELKAYLVGRMQSAEQAEEIVQAAFVRALRSIEGGTVPDNPRAWMYQIARHLSIDLHRSNRRQLPLESDELVDSEWQQELSAEREQEVFAAVARELPRFIRELPQPYRDALSAVDLAGQSHAQAAKSAGISLSAMKTRVHRGRKLLREALHACCSFELDGRQRVISCREKEANRSAGATRCASSGCGGESGCE